MAPNLLSLVLKACLLGTITRCVTGSMSDFPEYQLVQHLLANYSTHVRPVIDPSTVIDVQLGMALNQIIDVDERNQIMTTKVWMRLRWTDESFLWDPMDYDNITSVRIMAQEIWRPDITLYNDVGEDLLAYEKFFPADVAYDGRIKWNYPAILRSTCQLNVDYFPWDQQNCDLKFGSWTYDGFKVDLFNLTGDLAAFVPSGEWKMIGFPSERNEVIYSCCPEPYPDVTFWVVIRRKPLYYLFNLILPCIFITATTVLVFYLPSESGEKVSLGVTVLLALAVFLLLVAEAMPPQSDSVPLIAQYFGATIVLLSLSTALTVIVLNVYHRGAFGNEVPYFVQLVVLNWMARLMCLKKRVDDNLTGRDKRRKNVVENGHVNHGLTQDDLETGDKEMEKPSSEVVGAKSERMLGEICGILRQFQARQVEQVNDEGCRTNWMLVAMVVDRFLLFVFVALTVVVSSVILCNHPAYGYDTVTEPLPDS